jgi:ribose 5-phosphate isomerase B
MKTFTVAIGSDHAGFAYKEAIKAMLLAEGHVVRDFGTHSDAACDYPDWIRPVAEAVARGEFERGIVLGGSGNGEAIVANRVRGVRCGLCWNEQVAAWNRAHNDGNVLSLGLGDRLAHDRVRGWPPPAPHPQDRRRLTRPPATG